MAAAGSTGDSSTAGAAGEASSLLKYCIIAAVDLWICFCRLRADMLLMIV